MRAFGLYFLSVSLLACGGEGSNSNPAELTGTWQRFGPDGVTVREELTLNANGRFRYWENVDANEVTGTWDAGTRDMSLRTDNQAPDVLVEFTYYADATRLLYATLRPTGAANGMVGEWVGLLQMTELGSDGNPAASANGDLTTFLVRDDGTATMTVEHTDGAPTSVIDYTYTRVGSNEVELLANGAIEPVTWYVIDGLALGGTLYRRM